MSNLNPQQFDDHWSADARSLSASLKKAGFKRQSTSSTRVRGAPHFSEGFTAEKYVPLRDQHGALGRGPIVRIHYNQGEWTPSRQDANPAEKHRQIAQHLRGEGHRVHQFHPDGDVYVLSSPRER